MMVTTTPTALHAPFAPRPVGDVSAVVLLHVGCAGQARVLGFVDGFDVVFTLNFYHAFCRNVLKWSQEASPTAVDSAMCTAVARSYGSLAESR